MQELLNHFFPNILLNQEIFFTAIYQTLEMVVISGIISFVISLFLAVVLVATKEEGVKANKIIWNILDKIINLFRSIPFIILIAALIPLTRLIAGTAIGVQGTIFPLIVGITPFFTRQIESALNETDAGLIETGKVIGLTPLQILWSVYLHESVASIARVTTITLVSLVGLTAIVGVVGGGGLGDFAIQYGYQLNQFDATIACVVALLVLVSIIQIFGTLVSKRATH